MKYTTFARYNKLRKYTFVYVNMSKFDLLYMVVCEL